MDNKPDVGVATRSLLGLGFEITNSCRSPRHIEIVCERHDDFGANIKYIIAINLSQEDQFSEPECENFCHSANNQGRVLVLVSMYSSPGQLSWNEFLDALGGGIPSWRALKDFYVDWLLEASRNQLPKGGNGEAWRLFEELVADGFEFLFGRRVQRMGGRKRGTKVSDLIAVLPDDQLLVVDAKAGKGGFEVTPSTLRSLGEYTKRQIDRQRGQLNVFSAVIVSSDFVQDKKALSELSRQFNAVWSVPLSFLDTELFATAITEMKTDPTIRNAVRWRMLFAGGRVTHQQLNQEIKDARAERYPGRDD